MGQRSTTETLFGIVAAFLEHPTWSQAALAKRLETRPETIRKYLLELQAGGLKLERDEDHPHVYWSVPKNWFPGALAFNAAEARDVLRLITRAPRGALRSRVVEITLSRLANLGHAKGSFDPKAVQGREIAVDEERWLSTIEDAANAKAALKLRYYTASRRAEGWRTVSVHRVDLEGRPHFVATCHRANALRRFRLSNVLDSRPAPGEAFRSVTDAALAKFDRESFGGFHLEGPAVSCIFFAREPEAAWVAKNLPDDRIEAEPVTGGMRFRVETTAVAVLARFVVGLGGVAWAESPELAEEVARIARAALASASFEPPRSSRTSGRFAHASETASGPATPRS